MATENPTEKKSYKETLNLPETAFPMKADLVTSEPKRLEKWRALDLYRKVIDSREGAEKWVLHDGPPFANGDIHIGHVINKTLKDVFIRFKTMQGFQTPYVPGWDCHGLPIEHKIQEELKKEGKQFREVDTLEVRRRCFEYAKKYAGVQSLQFQRLGILGEWGDPYLTMVPSYEASTLEVFAKFVEAGLVEKQLKPVPWSVANQTALADAELEYKDVEDISVYVEFLMNGPFVGTGDGPHYLLVWTTTPWTLPANLAVAVHPDVEYSFVRYARLGQGRVAIVASELVEKVFAKSAELDGGFEVVKKMSGLDLQPLMAYISPISETVRRGVLAKYVTTDSGTGLVHTAPGHGADDYETGKLWSLDVYSPVLPNGRFDDSVPEFLRGKSTKEGNTLIVEKLRETGLLFAVEKIVHSYPHDWRSKTPIIFRATEQWFVRMEKAYRAFEGDENKGLRRRAEDACDTLNFIPAWGRDRLLGMLRTRPDWNISRQRAWGLPIPVFYNEEGAALLTPQSVRAVAKRFAEKGSDAWFTESPSELLAGFDPGPSFPKEKLRKEKDIFDVWFESGTSWHAVLLGRDTLKFPADLYLEGSDQHRGWFQLSLLPALGATGHAPFRQVLTHGFIVKPDGSKVSKSDKEYVTATQEIDRHGADLLRLWCSSVDYQGDVPTSPKVIQEFGDKYRKLRNTLRYLLSNLYDFNPETDTQKVPLNSLDGWVSAELDQLVRDVTEAYNAYQTHRVFKLLHEFCNVQISAIYGNAMKDRLYCEAPNSPIRRRSQTVMYRMAVVLTKLLAPMLVYTADEAWEYILHKPVDEKDLSSVHLAHLPKPLADEVSDEQKAEWKQLFELRDAALLQLDGLKKSAGLNKALEAEVIFQVDDDAMRRRLESYGVDLEDMVGAGFHSFAEKGAEGAAVGVKVIDRRNDYPACARSWKRRPDVGKDPAFPDLSMRDAAAVKGL